MKISLKGLSPEQKQQVRTIVQLGQSIGGTEQIDNYLMSQLMNVYMPETDKIDELASLYDITGEESLKDEILSEYYKKQGIDPAKRAQDEALSATFAEKYPAEQSNDKKAYENTQFQSMMQQSPEMLSKFYNYEQPKRSLGEAWQSSGGVLGSPVSLLLQMLGQETEKQKRERLSGLYSQYQSNLPRQ